MLRMQKSVNLNLAFEFLRNDPNDQKAQELHQAALKFYMNKNQIKTLDLLLQIAEENVVKTNYTTKIGFDVDIYGCVQLLDICTDGPQLLNQRKKEALQWFYEIATQNNNPYAYALTGVLSWVLMNYSPVDVKGGRLEKYEELTFFSLHRAATQGVFYPLFLLARFFQKKLYFSSLRGNQGYDELCNLAQIPRKKNSVAFEYFCDQQNHPGTLLCLGKMYLYGIGIEEDKTKAFGYFSRAYEQNNVAALPYLAVFYLYGIVVDKNEKRGMELLYIAVEQNNAVALFYLGMCYLFGLFVEENHDIACEYFSGAAERGHWFAFQELAKLVENNNIHALLHIFKLEENGVNFAFQYLENFEIRNYEKIYELLYSSAQHQDRYAQKFLSKLLLGYIRKFNPYLKVNIKDGLQWFQIRKPGKEINPKKLLVLWENTTVKDTPTLNAFLDQYNQVAEHNFPNTTSLSIIQPVSSLSGQLEIERVAKLTTLTSLSIANYSMDLDIAKTLLNPLNLCSLLLDNCHLIKYRAIKASEISEIFEEFVTTLSQMSKLSSFALKNDKLTFSEINSLITLFKTRPLMHLCLDNNNLEEEGAESLALALKENPKLQTLEIQYNKIRNRGGTHIAEALLVNSHLTALNLSRNHLHKVRIIASLKNVLINNSSLTALYLRLCDINDKGANLLAEALGQNSSLTMLDLYGNYFTYQAADYFITALATNISLITLNLSNQQSPLRLLHQVNPLGKEIQLEQKKTIEQALNENRLIAIEENPITRVNLIVAKTHQISFPSLLAMGLFHARQNLVGLPADERMNYLSCVPEEVKKLIEDTDLSYRLNKEKVEQSELPNAAKRPRYFL